MNRDIVINKIEALYDEYKDYKEFYEEYEEKIFKESRKTLAEKIKEPNFEEEFEKWAKDKIKLSHYRDDINLLYNKLKHYFEFCKDLGIEEYIPEDTKLAVKNDSDREFKPVFIFRGDKPEEVESGYVDKKFKEQIDLEKFLSKIKQ